MKRTILSAIFLIYGIAHAQVAMQSGSSVFNLPLFNWKDPKSRLNATASLAYNSGNGLKVDELASNIGQGWTLSLGGHITRMQIGQPDDQIAATNKYPDGYLYNSQSISNGCPKTAAYYPIYTTTNVLYKEPNVVTADKELDYFSFEFNGRSGLFVLDKSNKPNVRFLGDSKLKLTYTETDMTGQGIRTTISSFTIQDENGLIYRFQDKNLAKVLRSRYAGVNSNGTLYSLSSAPSISTGSIVTEAMFDELLSNENPYIVSSWELTEIEDPLTQRKIFFSYLSKNMDVYNGKSIAYFSYGVDPYVTLSHRRSVSKTLVLTEVQFPDGYKFTPIYNYLERHDLKGDTAIAAMDFKYNGKIQSRLELIHDYLGNTSDNKLKRLYLTGIKKMGPGGSIDEYDNYSFEYYAGTNTTEDFIPPAHCNNKDIYGYYNGDYSITSAPSDFFLYTYLTEFEPLNSSSTYNKPKSGYAKNGILKKITLPTGGNLTYEYQQNTDANGTYVGGVHVSRVTSNEGSGGSNIITDYSYVLSTGQSSMWGTETPKNDMFVASYFEPKGQYWDPLSGCDYDYKYPGITSYEQATNISSSQQFMAVFSKTISFVSMSMDVMGIINAASQGAAASAALVSSVFSLVYQLLLQAIDCGSETYDFRQILARYNFNLKSANPLPAQFKRVEVKTYSATTNNGKTVYEFTNPDDYPAGYIESTLSAPYSSKQRTLPWAFGLEKKIIFLDNNNNKVKEIENVYDWTNAKTQLPSGFQSCKCEIKQKSSIKNDLYEDVTFQSQFTNVETSDIKPDFYELYTGRIELKETYERNYKDASNYLQTKLAYTYSPANYLVRSIETTQSNNDKVVVQKYYSSDYTATGVLATLNSHNILNEPVAEYYALQKNGSSTLSYLTGSVLDYTTLSNGNITPYRKLIGRSPSLVTGFSFNGVNPLNYPNLIEVQTYTFDTDGLLVKAKDEGNRIVSHIYDYDGRFTTAMVVNASPADIAYTSFETGNTGNWTITGGTYEDDLYNAPTGRKVLYLNTYEPGTSLTKSGLNANTLYIVSYWLKDGSMTVNGASSLPVYTVNGWSLYIHEVTAATMVTLAGDAYIDELRLYPKAASMTTTAFDPVVGKISDCDANNRIMYYKYSLMGELVLIQDQQRNAVKSFEYNYRNRTKRTINIH
jgi:hypothetical protein